MAVIRPGQHEPAADSDLQSAQAATVGRGSGLRGSRIPHPAVSSVNSFHELSSHLSAQVGIAIASVGSRPVSFDTWSPGDAWSTSMLPLVIAALRTCVGSHELAAQTIIRSDNYAAEQLWSQLGDPACAARQVQDVIREAGDAATVVESRRLREDYTPFG